MKFVSMIQIPASKVAERKENESLVKDFLKKGGVIQLKKPKRTANSHSWGTSRMRGAIANRGRKSTTLRSIGLAKSNG